MRSDQGIRLCESDDLQPLGGSRPLRTNTIDVLPSFQRAGNQVLQLSGAKNKNGGFHSVAIDQHRRMGKHQLSDVPSG